MVLFIPGYEKLEQPQCRRLRGRYQQHRFSPDQPLCIFPARNGRGEASGGATSVFPSVQALGGNKSLCLGTPRAIQNTNYREGFVSRQYQCRGSFSQATTRYRSQNESPKRCCGFSLGFLRILDCTELSSGT